MLASGQPSWSPVFSRRSARRAHAGTFAGRFGRAPDDAQSAAIDPARTVFAVIAAHFPEIR